jgi:hypothetical protein
MELEPHPLHENLAVVNFADENEYSIAAKALLGSGHAGDFVKGLQLKSRPVVDAITGRVDAHLAPAYERDINMTHDQLQHLAEKLEHDPAEEADETERLDRSIILEQIHDYFQNVQRPPSAE